MNDTVNQIYEELNQETKNLSCRHRSLLDNSVSRHLAINFDFTNNRRYAVCDEFGLIQILANNINECEEWIKTLPEPVSGFVINITPFNYKFIKKIDYV